MYSAPGEWHSAVLPQLAELYKDLHRHPELSGQEARTARVLAEALEPLGWETHTGIGGHGIATVLRNGDGPTVMLRADFDALPVEEATGLPYASTEQGTAPDGEPVPVMHACGHDMHATALVGAARLLDEAKESWSGTLVVVMQPAEELATGARDMITDGLFDRVPRPDIVLGQHVGPLPAGYVGYREGPVMAGVDEATITVYGRGGHGARPETAVDPVLLAANVVVRLQGIVARELPATEAAVVTVGQLHAGTKNNIIPDRAELGLTIRTYSDETRQTVRAAIERIARAEAAASGSPKDPEIEWGLSAPVLVSDEESTRTTVAAIGEQLGHDKLLPLPQVTASEDVGVFGRELGVPTVFWFWGGLDAETVVGALTEGTHSELPGNHSPEFAPVIDPTLETGVLALVAGALAWLDT